MSELSGSTGCDIDRIGFLANPSHFQEPLPCLTESLTHNVSLQLKTDYITMLKEFSGLDRHSRWSETKKKLESDARYKAIESSSRREDWFRDYTKRLDDVSMAGM